MDKPMTELELQEEKHLLKILNALIDTAERASELKNVYNDKTGESVSWSTVYITRLAITLRITNEENTRSSAR